MKKEERIRKQLERLAEMKRMEQALHAQGYQYIAGVDEVGRGPLAGPVVTAAVVLPEDFDVPGVDDSKKLSEKKREELYEVILERALAVGIGQADQTVIDEINILQATKRAMRQAIDEADRCLKERLNGAAAPAEGLTAAESAEDPNAAALAEDPNAAVLAEGLNAAESDRGMVTGGDPAIDFVLLDAVELAGLPIPQQAVIKGDAKVLAIAAASIVAKVTRDRMMVEYAGKYPYYAFERNKGYGTKDHYAGIREHGICPIHRRSFLKTIH